MNKLKQLIKEKAEEAQAANAILTGAEAEGRELTSQEECDIDAHLAKADSLGAEIEAAQASEDRKEKTRKAAADSAAVQPRRVASATPAGNGQWNAPAAESSTPVVVPGVRYAKTVAFANNPAGYEQAYRAGRWVQAALFGNTSAQKWCSEHGVDFRAVHSEGVNTAGGALVPDEMSSAIINNREMYGVFRRLVRPTPMSRDTIGIPRRTGGMTAYFTGEGVAATESDTAWDTVQATAKKLVAVTRVSSELDEDAIINIGDMIADEIALAFAFKEDTVGFNGTGTASDGGIQGIKTRLEGDSSLAGHVVVPTATHNLFTEVDAADLAAVMGAVPQYARVGASWMCSQTAYDVIFGRLASAAGGNTIQTVSGAFAPSYLGFPIEVSQVLPSDSTADMDGLAILLFGNLGRASVLAERRGMTMSTTDQRYWDTDQIGIKATERVDIVNHSIGDATTAGPVAALVGSSS